MAASDTAATVHEIQGDLKQLRNDVGKLCLPAAKDEEERVDLGDFEDPLDEHAGDAAAAVVPA